jgi:hypothetical protein
MDKTVVKKRKNKKEEKEEKTTFKNDFWLNETDHETRSEAEDLSPGRSISWIFFWFDDGAQHTKVVKFP